MKLLAYISVLLLLLVSCRKAENRNCWKSKGKEITEVRDVNGFDKLELYDGIDYILIQDSMDFVTVNTGENLINFIETKVESSTLIIRDNNKCNFLRDLPVRVKVEIHYTALYEVYNESYGNITGSINMDEGYFQWDNWEGATRIELELSLDSTEFALHTGAPQFIGHGQANLMYLFTSGYCHINCSDLVANNGQAHNAGIGDIRIRVNDGWLRCIVENFGNVYYTGSNFELGIQDRGEGDILQF